MKRTLVSLSLALPIVLSPLAHADTFYLEGTSLTGERAGTTGSMTNVPYPASLVNMGASTTIGQKNLDKVIASTSGPTTVLGISQGTIVIDKEKAALMAEPNRPAANNLTFIEYGDPDTNTGILGRNPHVTVPILNIKRVKPVETPYNTEIVVRQYDGIADWPRDQRNLLADANAIAGIIELHPHYSGLDLSTANKSSTTNSLGGVTTTYLVPTKTLPLLAPLRQIGVPKQVVAALNKVLKPIVDSAYKPKQAKKG